MTHIGFALDLSGIDLWNIHLLDNTFRFVRCRHQPVKILLASETSSIRLQDMSSRRLQDISSRRLQDMSSRRLLDISSRRLEDGFSVTVFRLPRRLARGLENVLRRLRKTFSRRLQNVLEDEKFLCWRRVQDVFKTSWRPKNVWWVMLHFEIR